MVSTCLFSCPRSRTQLVQLPAHASPRLEIKQLFLELILNNITLCFMVESELIQKVWQATRPFSGEENSTQGKQAKLAYRYTLQTPRRKPLLSVGGFKQWEITCLNNPGELNPHIKAQRLCPTLQHGRLIPGSKISTILPRSKRGCFV